MIRVLVKASSAIARAGLEGLLQASAAVRLVEDSTADARTMSSDLPADVLLVEASTLADSIARDGIEWAAAGGPVVMLVHHFTPEAVAEALRAGVKAVLGSGRTGPEIVAAVEAAAAGLVVLDPSGMEDLLRAPTAATGSIAANLVEPLTPRELEVLQLLAAGLGNKEVAPRLCISEHTAKFHVAAIMGKLGASSRTEAVTLGIRHGLIMI
jgi:DNA-binding NarL/FixJ family response regulator